MEKQKCPRCGSTYIRLADAIAKLGDPIMTQNLVGWECLNCGHIGKYFFIFDTKKKSTENSNKGKKAKRNPKKIWKVHKE